ncbi:MAG: rRNA maturation RNase YbeY [Bacteroidetes bacterium]|nr:rRNA maturation RNase YbeY [Bacteroidota bacterium]MBK9524294.1 rRNA maturation RNase YbeY [Bacteroidota bacterium]MBK9543633.1 rRNA maturation RNase YbeY [Bacteroidota bacterium]
MRQMNIHFFKEEVKFRFLHQDGLRKWIIKAIRSEGYQLENLNIIFCSDKKLLQMNKDYLQHNYYTDIITFDLSSVKKTVEGDIFISVETVLTNSQRFKTTFQDELHRVMIHGVLHLLGYSDKNPKAQAMMKKMEDKWLDKRG